MLKIKNGITLIALIITIIILLVLAGVVLNLILGENGIINKVQNANEKYSIEQYREQLNIAFMHARMEKYSNPEYNSSTFLDNLLISDIPECTVDGDYVIINKYEFTIDRENLIVGDGVEINNSATGFRNNATILGAVKKVSQSGYSLISPPSDGEEIGNYSLHTIVYNGNLVLDGNNYYESIDGITYVSEENSYEIGSKQDVAKEITKDNNVKEIVDASSTVVLKVNGNIEISNGITLTSCKSDSGLGGPKGLVVYCTGMITNDGKISMTARGARAEGQYVYLWQNEDESYECVPKTGGLGGDRVSTPRNNSLTPGNPGKDGINRQTGGGGSGGACNGTSGSGGNGTSYSGGSGGGGQSCGDSVSEYTPSNGSSSGGPGGSGAAHSEYMFRRAGGGAGNPGGYGGAQGSGNQEYLKGENGTGGLLIIYANEIINNGIIESNGSKGKIYSDQSQSQQGIGGGSSGAGSINIFYKNRIVQNRIIRANGGEAASDSYVGNKGARGGNGSIFIGSVLSGSYIGTNIELEK